MDIIDEAVELELAHRQRAIAMHRAAITAEYGDGVCRECGDTIQPERLRAKPRAIRCIDCQIDHERLTAQELRG